VAVGWLLTCSIESELLSELGNAIIIQIGLSLHLPPPRGGHGASYLGLLFCRHLKGEDVNSLQPRELTAIEEALQIEQAIIRWLERFIAFLGADFSDAKLILLLFQMDHWRLHKRFAIYYLSVKEKETTNCVILIWASGTSTTKSITTGTSLPRCR
jgi:hypothetical protein